MVLNPLLLLLLPLAACEQLSSVLHPSQLVGFSPRTTPERPAQISEEVFLDGCLYLSLKQKFSQCGAVAGSPAGFCYRTTSCPALLCRVGFLHRLQDRQSGSPPDPRPLVPSLYRHTEVPNLTILRSVNTQHVEQIKISQSFSQQYSSLPS